jgi:hypothetical protein
MRYRDFRSKFLLHMAIRERMPPAMGRTRLP